jgi:hypothetical protein
MILGENIMIDTEKPPWNLSGAGVITLYKFERDFLKSNNLIPKFLLNKKMKGFGAVMFVNYEKSPVGPYQELLFIPSKFNINGKKVSTISKIYVSTEESLVNGYDNWAIPKELANFEVTIIDKKRTKVEITNQDEEIASFIFKETFLPVPISTKILGFNLLQKKNKDFYMTDFYGKGSGKMTIIEEQNINGKYFPDIKDHTPIITLKVNPFHITFPKPEIIRNL